MDSPAAAAQRDFAFTDQDFERVRRLIQARAGIALAPSKRQMVYSRLSRRLRALGHGSFRDYLDALERHGGDEWEAFTNALTTNLTSFFREAHHFEVFERFLKTQRRGRPARVWCAAASTGEEPYSIAISACEAHGTLDPPIGIVASDVDTQVLATAERGVYALERVERVDPARVRRFFQRGSGPNQGLCRVLPALRRLVQFRRINLLDASYGLDGPFDVVFCRNVMIYFDKPTQYAILSRIHRLLAPDGLLFAGHSESFFHAADLFRNCGRTVYQRADAARASA